MHNKDSRTVDDRHAARFYAPVLMLGFGLAAAIVAGSSTPTRGEITSEPVAMVQNTVNHALEVLRDHGISAQERRRKLIQIVAGHFDFSTMARESLGYHWRTITPAQREQFVPLYTSFMEDVYLKKLEGYSGQKIELLNQVPGGPGYTQINTRVVYQNGGQSIHINYQLEQNHSDWKVYDVIVDGISITTNYRTQFNRVINNEGFDSLMSKLRSKQQELTASLGDSSAN